MYRDAVNFKAYGDILLEGIITDTQIEVLRASLREETYYVPGQLGLGHLAHEAWPGSSYDDDDNWHEMFLSEIRRVDLAISALIRERGTQEAGTVAEFLAKVQGAATAGWNPRTDSAW
jgi:hypothetical protein